MEESPEETYQWLKKCEDIEGLTLSGGEPLEQAPEALLEFLRLVRSDPRKLGVICFTGYRLEEIQASAQAAILQYLDVLVDGPYMSQMNGNHDLRGSDNQRIFFLTPRYIPMKDAFFGAHCRNLEIELDLRNGIVINGIPMRDFLERFSKLMHDKGYAMNFDETT